MTEVVLTAPDISSEDFAAFHAAHFSSTSVDHFADHFLGPVDGEEYAEEVEDDGLGYYEDGVKRTLTDEQIAIFRHSEIQALLRERRHAQEAKEAEDESPIIVDLKPVIDDTLGDNNKEPVIGPMQPAAEEELEDGELDDDSTILSATTPQSTQSKSNKKNKRKNKSARKGQRPPQPKGFFKQNVKPDLRKRTWDVVDAGLGNLDYDEDTGASSATAHAAQRRRISYDDD